MSCITDDLIQKYIDEETNSEESVWVESHLLTCEQCACKMEIQKEKVRTIKHALNSLTKDNIEIPPMPILSQKNRRRPILRMSWVYTLAAASVLIFVLIFSTGEDINSYELSELNALEGEFDANLPVSEQQMIINVVDPSGKITEFYVD